MAMSVINTPKKNTYRPEMTNEGLKPSHEVIAIDEYGQQQAGMIDGTLFAVFLKYFNH